jgi:glyoxylase-like metal-dependent hydrolase (beta-lactamase superfamily II)
LEELGVTAESLKYAVITHPHVDHAGGLSRFLTRYPETEIVVGSEKLKEDHPSAKLLPVKEGDVLLDCLSVTEIPGHTSDAIGVIDSRTEALLCGDCLQQYGIYGSGLWGSNIRFPSRHLKAVEHLRTLPISRIVGAHDFHPVGFLAENGEQVTAILDACAESLAAIRAHLEQNPEKTDEELAESYNAPGLLPTVGKHVFAAIRKELEAGEMK